MKEIITLKGENDGSSASGDFPLYSDLIYHDSAPWTPPTKILIPYGLKAKIWAKRVAAQGATIFTIYRSNDVTATSPVWEAIDVEVLSSAGELALEKRRPVVIRSLTGKEGFKASWSYPSGTTPSKGYIELEVEFTDEE
jgi:hypothetical protein